MSDELQEALLRYMGLVLSGIALGKSIKTVLMIWLAPRVYIIEYLRELM